MVNDLPGGKTALYQCPRGNGNSGGRDFLDMILIHFGSGSVDILEYGHG
jgi:hypothetical protein